MTEAAPLQLHNPPQASLANMGCWHLKVEVGPRRWPRLSGCVSCVSAASAGSLMFFVLFVPRYGGGRIDERLVSVDVIEQFPTARVLQ